MSLPSSSVAAPSLAAALDLVHEDYADWSFQKRYTETSALHRSLEEQICNVRGELEAAAIAKRVAFDNLYQRLLHARERRTVVEQALNDIKQKEIEERKLLEFYSAKAANAKDKVVRHHMAKHTAATQFKSSTDGDASEHISSKEQGLSLHQKLLEWRSENIVYTGNCLKRGTYLRNRWRPRWFELTTTSLRYFVSEYDSVRRDVWPRGCIDIANISECRLVEKRPLRDPKTGSMQIFHTFMICGQQRNRNSDAKRRQSLPEKKYHDSNARQAHLDQVEFYLAAEQSDAVQWVSRIHRLMNRMRSRPGSAASSPERKAAIMSGSPESAQSAEAKLNHAREIRDECQENLLAILKSRENLLSRRRDLKCLEKALLGPLRLQNRFNLESESESTLSETPNNQKKFLSTTSSPQGLNLSETPSHYKSSRRAKEKSQNFGESSRNKTRQGFFDNGSDFVKWTRELLIPWHKQSNYSDQKFDSCESQGKSVAKQGNGIGRSNSKMVTALNSTRSSWGSNLDSHNAKWGEDTIFMLGCQQNQKRENMTGLIFRRITEATRSLLCMGEVMNAADTEEDRDALRKLLEADVKKKHLWRVLERLVVQKERTRVRLDSLSRSAGPGFSPLQQGAYGLEERIAKTTNSATPRSSQRGVSTLTTNLAHLGDTVVDESVGPLFNISF